METFPLAGVVLVLVIIAILELFDRTSFALIALAAKAPARGTWAGAALAFTLTTLLAVGVGTTLLVVLGPSGTYLLRVAGGLFLIGYALWLARRGPEDEPLATKSHGQAFWAAFVTILLLELGDTTMIFEVVFVGSVGWLAVLIGGVAALALVAAWDVWLGGRLGQRLEPRTLHRGVVVVLLVVGAWTILYGLEPGWFPALATVLGS